MFANLITCILGFLCVASGSVIPELTSNNFDENIDRVDIALVIFYASYCKTCGNSKPEYIETAKRLANINPPVFVYQLDCLTEGNKTCSKYNVTKSPTLLIFRQGKFFEKYTSELYPEVIVHHIKTIILLPSRKLTSKKEFKRFSNSTMLSVVGVFQKGSQFHKDFESVADLLKSKARFGHITSKKLADKIGISEGILLYRPWYMKNKYENNSFVYKGTLNNTQIFKFIKRNGYGLVGVRNYDNEMDFNIPLVVTYYRYDFNNEPVYSKYVRNRMLKTAKNFQKIIHCAVSHILEYVYDIEDFGLKKYDSKKPLVLAYGLHDKKFIMKEDFTEETFANFVKYLSKGLIEPFVKSQEIPKKNFGPLKIAVARTFNQMVFKNGRDTMLLIYLFWSTSSKKVQKVYKEFAEKMRGEPVDVIQIDAHSNDVPKKFVKRGIPAIFWIPLIEKNRPVQYSEKYTVESLVNFTATYASVALNKYPRPKKAEKDEL